MLDSDKAFVLMVVATAMVAVVWISLKILSRRRRPSIHPRLQKYAGPDADYVRQRRAEAAGIVVTASTPAVAGYEITEHVEALFVDGFNRPDEALEGLKAVAVMKGANAVINVRQERTADGRSSAGGDAVVVRKVGDEHIT